MHTSSFALAVLATSVAAQKYLVSNDDGWATAQARAQYDSLVASGFKVILSAPAVAHTDTGNATSKPVVLQTPCQFNSCDVGSPAEGSDPSDPHLNYVNGFGVDAVRYGINTLAPKLFGQAPDIVIAGPNVGGAHLDAASVNNSSNFQVAVKAVKLGIPAIAVWGGANGTTSSSYKKLTTQPNSKDTKAAQLYANLTNLFVTNLYNSGKPYLPANLTLAINYPPIEDCPAVSDYKFVLSKIATGKIETVQTCGNAQLPQADNVIAKAGCYASVTVLNVNTLKDVNAKKQQKVLTKLGSIISCLD